MDDERNVEAIAAARREIARRIVRLCPTLTAEELGRLLDRMAYVQWKYEALPLTEEPPPPEEHNRGLTD